jgi:hypothetical protein
MSRKFKNRDWVVVKTDKSQDRGKKAKIGTVGQVFYQDDPLIIAKGWSSFGPTEVIFIPKGSDVNSKQIYYWHEFDLELLTSTPTQVTNTRTTTKVYCQCSPEVPTKENFALSKSFQVCLSCKKERIS